MRGRFSRHGVYETGRHLQEELFPFSWAEYRRFRGLDSSGVAFEQYLSEGGFPEFLKTGIPEILRQALSHPPPSWSILRTWKQRG